MSFGSAGHSSQTTAFLIANRFAPQCKRTFKLGFDFPLAIDLSDESPARRGPGRAAGGALKHSLQPADRDRGQTRVVQ
jgi:hypothetical protein